MRQDTGGNWIHCQLPKEIQVNRQYTVNRRLILAFLDRAMAHKTLGLLSASEEISYILVQTLL